MDILDFISWKILTACFFCSILLGLFLFHSEKSVRVVTLLILVASFAAVTIFASDVRRVIFEEFSIPQELVSYRAGIDVGLDKVANDSAFITSGYASKKDRKIAIDWLSHQRKLLEDQAKLRLPEQIKLDSSIYLQFEDTLLVHHLDDHFTWAEAINFRARQVQELVEGRKTKLVEWFLRFIYPFALSIFLGLSSGIQVFKIWKL